MHLHHDGVNQPQNQWLNHALCTLSAVIPHPQTQAVPDNQHDPRVAIRHLCGSDIGSKIAGPQPLIIASRCRPTGSCFRTDSGNTTTQPCILRKSSGRVFGIPKPYFSYTGFNARMVLCGVHRSTSHNQANTVRLVQLLLTYQKRQANDLQNDTHVCW